MSRIYDFFLAYPTILVTTEFFILYVFIVCTTTVITKLSNSSKSIYFYEAFYAHSGVQKNTIQKEIEGLMINPTNIFETVPPFTTNYFIPSTSLVRLLRMARIDVQAALQ